jgi:hypothetical protein
MKRMQRMFGSALAFLMVASAPAAANGQHHVIDAGQLAATVAERAAADDRDRAAIREALARAEVRDVASTIGVDLDRIAESAQTLSGSDLERAANAARQVNDRLVGGASVTLSTTTIIIALLVLILLIVALK